MFSYLVPINPFYIFSFDLFLWVLGFVGVYGILRIMEVYF